MKKSWMFLFACMLAGLMSCDVLAWAETKTPWYTGSSAGVMFSEASNAQGALETLEDFGASPWLSLRVGYKPDWSRFNVGGKVWFEAHLAHFLKYDMTVRKHPPKEGGRVVARPKRHGATYSAWLWGFYGPDALRWERLQPFVGVGGGVVYMDSYPSDGFRPAVGLQAGIALKMTEKLTVDIAYFLVNSPFGGRVNHMNHGLGVGFQLPFG